MCESIKHVGGCYDFKAVAGPVGKFKKEYNKMQKLIENQVRAILNNLRAATKLRDGK